MYNIGPGTIDAFELATMQAEVGSLLTDTTTTTSLSWRSGGVRSYNPATGLSSYNETATTCYGWISSLTVNELASYGDAQVGDVKILIRTSDVTPVVNDRAVVGAVTYSIYRVETGPISTHSIAFGRKQVS